MPARHSPTPSPWMLDPANAVQMLTARRGIPPTLFEIATELRVSPSRKQRLAAAPATAAVPASWLIVDVHDGDTLAVLDAGNVQHRIWLQRIDAAELDQPFGRVARNRLAEIAKG